MTRTTLSAWMAAFIASAGTACATLSEQPPPPSPQEPARHDAVPGSDEKLRERLEQALKESEQAQQKLHAAIEKLNKGEDPAAVKRELDMPLLRFWISRDGQEGPGVGPMNRFRDRVGGEGIDRGPPGRGPEGRGPDGPGPDEIMHGDRGPGPQGQPAPRDRRFGPDQASRPMGPGRSERPGDGPGGRPEGGPPGGGPGGPGGMPPEDKERLAAAVEREMPEIAALVRRVREEHPQLAERMLGRLAPRVREALQAREHDPEVFQLRVDEIKSGLDVLVAIHGVRQAKQLPDDGADTKSKRDAADKALRSAVGVAFDQRLRLDEHEAQRLSARVNEIRSEIEKKKSGREKAVDDIIGRINRGEMPPP